METYTLDYFSVSTVLTAAAIFLGISAVGTVGFFVLGPKEKLTWLTLIVLMAVGGIMGWGVTKQITEDQHNEARLDLLIEQTEEVYGLELDREQAEALNPPFTEPAEDYAEFGTAVIPYMDGEIPALLVWNEGVLFYGIRDSQYKLPTLEEQANMPPAEEQPSEIIEGEEG